VRKNRTPGSVRGRPGQLGVLPRYDASDRFDVLGNGWPFDNSSPGIGKGYEVDLCCGAQEDYDSLMNKIDDRNEYFKKLTINIVQLNVDRIKGKITYQELRQKSDQLRIESLAQPDESILSDQIQRIVVRCPGKVQERDSKEFPDLDAKLQAVRDEQRKLRGS